MDLSQTDFSWEDNLPFLVLKSFDGSLTDKELQELRSRLNSDESARLFFARSSVLQSQLETHFAISLDVDVDSMTTDSARTKRYSFYRAFFTKNVLLLSACAFFWCGAILLTYHLFFASSVPSEIGIEKIVTSNTQKNNSTVSRNLQTIKEGSVELLLPTGVKVLVTAPATFQITGKNEITLTHGMLMAEVLTETGKGFTVKTPRSSIVDLGTIFSVHATKDLNTEVQVYRGKVIASLLNPQGVILSSQQVKENEAVKIDVAKEEMVDVPYSSNDFITRIQKEYGIKQHSETVVFQEKAMPTSIAMKRHKDFEHDHSAFLFLEKRDVLLKQKLEVYSTSVSGQQDDKQYSYQKKLIPAETKVDSFFLFYNPQDNKSLVNPVRGVIQFDRPILGIIIDKKNFLKSDQIFRSPEEDGANVILERSESDINVSRKIEKSSFRQDYVIISEDRKRLTFQLVITEMGTDEFRVIVKSQDVPDH